MTDDRERSSYATAQQLVYPGALPPEFDHDQQVP